MLYLFVMETGAPIHCQHAHQQAVNLCNTLQNLLPKLWYDWPIGSAPQITPERMQPPLIPASYACKPR